MFRKGYKMNPISSCGDQLGKYIKLGSSLSDLDRYTPKTLHDWSRNVEEPSLFHFPRLCFSCFRQVTSFQDLVEKFRASKVSTASGSKHKYQELYRARIILLCQLQGKPLKPPLGLTWSQVPALASSDLCSVSELHAFPSSSMLLILITPEVSQLNNSFPDENGHFRKFTRSEYGLRRSVQELKDCFMYKQGIEFISMHFCFVFKRAVAKFEADWVKEPGRVRAKLIELEKDCNLYCPIGILLQEAFGKKARKCSQA